MCTKTKTFIKGDSYFLFTHFPLNYASLNPNNEPIKIYEGVYLVSTPVEILTNPGRNRKKENIAIAEWVYPGFHLPGLGICHTSVKIEASIHPDEQRSLFWALVGSLFLIKPLFIHIAGSFTYGSDDTDLIHNPAKIDLRANLSLNLFRTQTQMQNELKYDTQDIELTKQIFPHLLEDLKPNKNNLRSSYNIQQFLQTFFFEKLNYRGSIYSKLFALIDSLAGNPSFSQAQHVSKRLGKFLSDISFDHNDKHTTEKRIIECLKYVWELHRYPVVHGHIKEGICPKGKAINSTNIILPDNEDLQDLWNLSEIARITLLKILLLDKKNKKEYSQIPIPPTGKSTKEAKDDNKKRDAMANNFFDQIYNNSDNLIFYSDLQAKP